MEAELVPGLAVGASDGREEELPLPDHVPPAELALALMAAALDRKAGAVRVGEVVPMTSVADGGAEVLEDTEAESDGAARAD